MIIKPENPEKLVNLLKSKPLILYGMGDTGIRISKWCDEQDIDYLFADKHALELQETFGKNVLTQQSVVNEHTDANIVVSSIVYNKEITEELLQLGIEKERIFPYSLFMPDETTWIELENNNLAGWKLMHKRCEMISEWGWIPKDVKTVVDYGAGQKFIKEYLPVSAAYYPVDYIDRGDHTIICDFNKSEFPNIHSEVSVCNGVLMYIEPADRLVSHICEHTKHAIIFSYITLEGFSDINARRRTGMCNEFTEQQIVDMFFSYNFELKDRKYDTAGNTTITFYLFQKSGDVL